MIQNRALVTVEHQYALDMLSDGSVLMILSDLRGSLQALRTFSGSVSPKNTAYIGMKLTTAIMFVRHT